LLDDVGRGFAESYIFPEASSRRLPGQSERCATGLLVEAPSLLEMLIFGFGAGVGGVAFADWFSFDSALAGGACDPNFASRLLRIYKH